MSATEQLHELVRQAPVKLIGARIRRARKASGLSHDRLGEKVGTSRQHLIRLEKGDHRPRPEMVSRIAEATGKPVDYFLVEEAGEPNPFPAGQAA